MRRAQTYGFRLLLEPRFQPTALSLLAVLVVAFRAVQILPVKPASDLACVRDSSIRGEIKLIWETLRSAGR